MSRYQFPSAGFTAIASGTILGNGLGDTALPQALNASATRTILGLATFDAPTFAGLTLSGLQQFTGTSTVGLRVKSLTTAEYELLTPANGDLYRDSTTDRIDARLARGTVELVDTAGGQVIAGNLAATTLMVGDSTGPLLRNNAGTIEARNNANSSGAPFGCSNLTASGTVTNQGIRLLQTAGGTLRGILNCPAWSTSYVSLQNGTLAESAANSAINQSALGDTIVNAALGRSLFLRNNNSTIAEVTATGIAVTGNLTASGTLRVGGGTVVQTILSATATLDFPSISSNDTHTLTITVTGAVAGDSVFLGVPAGLDAGLIFCASVTAADTVTVRMHNSSGGSIDPASGTFRATVIRF